MPDFRKKFNSELRAILEPDTTVLAIWEGGSAATGYLDEYSDVDMGLICSDDRVEAIFSVLEEHLESNYGIRHRYRVPEPSWHGHSQCYYVLDNTPPLFFFDLLIEKESSGNRFLESDRHGKAVVWFDRKGLIDTTPTPKETVTSNCKKALEKLKDSYEIMFLDIEKLVKRGKYIDAVFVYFQLMTRYSYLLNMKFRPAKYDFGLRYTYREFPKEETDALEKLMTVSSLNDVDINLEILKKRIRELLKDLKF